MCVQIGCAARRGTRRSAYAQTQRAPMNESQSTDSTDPTDSTDATHFAAVLAGDRPTRIRRDVIVGEGNDTVSARGSIANNVLLGGAGNDRLPDWKR